MKTTLVTCYVNPDLDGVAGAIGYAEFLTKSGQVAQVGIIGDIHEEARYVFDRFHFPHPSTLASSEGYEQIILVDASDLNGLEGKIDPQKVIEVIDHRQVHEADKFPQAKIQIELVGAAATLIAEKFMQAKLPISQEAATLIYSAIISNTLNFKAPVTTDRDRQAATWLNQTAKLGDNFWKELFIAKSDLSGEKLEERIRGDFAWFEFSGKKLGIAQIEIIGATTLIAQREAEIIDILKQLKKELGLDFIFQNTIELEEGKNFLVTADEDSKKLLIATLNLEFKGQTAIRPELIMRKQIVPIIKAYLEK
jgi:manganese-dependent inorganic pyrophosphatase